MTVLGITLAIAIALIWALTLVDIIRQHYSGWTTAGWVALILILPFVGSVIYFATRKPTAAEAKQQAEQQYRAQEDLRRGAADRPFDSTSMR